MNPSVQVIGFGPAALGLPLAADRIGELDRLAALGIAFVERAVSPAVVRATGHRVRPTGDGAQRRAAINVFHGLDAEDIVRSVSRANSRRRVQAAWSKP